MRERFHAPTRGARPGGPQRQPSSAGWGALLLLVVLRLPLDAQDVPSAAADTATDQLSALLAHARAANPALRAARDRVESARARVQPAGTLPDPMLGLGIMNLPLDGGGYTEMTMNTLMLGQMLPYPGKLPLQRRIAESELAAAEARLDGTRLDLERDVRTAYYELVFLDHAIGVVARNQRLLVDLIGVTESRYGVGSGGQQDVLKARVEASRLAEQGVALAEQRYVALARLNALLGRPSETPVPAPRFPERIARAAGTRATRGSLFVSDVLGARAADSPLPPLNLVEQKAIRNSPEVHAHEAEIAAQAARLELAGRAHLPDFDLSLQYGQRPDRSDMLTIAVAVPLPVRRESRQAAYVTESRADLSALQAEHHAHLNRIRAAVAEAYSDAERARTQLALFATSILPQGQAALESATAGFQVGRVDFLTLVDNQAILYGYETAYYRALTDFARSVADLERLVGEEVLR